MQKQIMNFVCDGDVAQFGLCVVVFKSSLGAMKVCTKA
jgi:hypothetical protein